MTKLFRLLLPLFLLVGCVSAGPARESLDSIARDYVKLQLAIGGYLVLRLAPVHHRHQEEEALQDREIGSDGDVERLEERRG